MRAIINQIQQNDSTGMTAQQARELQEVLPNCLHDLVKRLEKEVPGIESDSDSWADTPLGKIASDLDDIAGCVERRVIS